MIAAKNFPGWFPIGRNDIIKQGDVFVNCSPFASMKPETGEDALFGIGQPFNRYLQISGEDYPYRVYRKGSMISIQKRLRLNPHFSKQLPLP